MNRCAVRWAFSGFAVMAAALAAAGPLVTARPDGGMGTAQNTFQDSRGHFAIDLPTGWRLEPQTDEKVFVFKGEGQAIIIECVAGVSDPDELLDKALATVRASGMDFPELDGYVTEMTMNGLPARWGVYKGAYNPVPGVTLAVLCGSVASGEDGLYFLSFLSLADLAKWKGRLGAAFETLRGHGQKVTGVVSVRAAGGGTITKAAATGGGQPKPAAPVPPGQESRVELAMSIGDSSLLSDEFADAIENYGRVIDLDPRSVEAHFKRAWTYLERKEKGDDDRAVADASRALELDPAYKLARFARGKAYVMKARAAEQAKNLKEADRFYDKALADLTRARDANFNAVKLFPNYIFFHKNPPAMELLANLGQAHFGKGDLDRALAAYSSAYEMGDAYRLGIYWALRGVFSEFDRQKRDIEVGNSPKTLLLLGNYYKESYPDLAIGYLTRALGFLSDKGLIYDAYIDRSVAYAKKGDFASALADADNALKTYNFVSGYENRAEIYQKKGDLNKAVSDYNEAIKVEKKNIEKERKFSDVTPEKLGGLYYKRGLVFLNMGSYDKAIADLVTVEKMVLPGPDQAKIDRLIADVYRLKGDAKNSEKYLKKARDMDPGAKK